MDDLIKALDELEDLLKKDPQFNPSIKLPTPSIKLPKPKGGTAGIPMPAPVSKKDPMKVAQQIKNPRVKELKIKELVKYNPLGQWEIELLE